MSPFRSQNGDRLLTSASPMIFYLSCINTQFCDVMVDDGCAITYRINSVAIYIPIKGKVYNKFFTDKENCHNVFGNTQTTVVQ